MRECSNHTAPPFIFYIQCYKIVLMFYNGLGIGEGRELKYYCRCQHKKFNKCTSVGLSTSALLLPI